MGARYYVGVTSFRERFRGREAHVGGDSRETGLLGSGNVAGWHVSLGSSPSSHYYYLLDTDRRNVVRVVTSEA